MRPGAGRPGRQSCRHGAPSAAASPLTRRDSGPPRRSPARGGLAWAAGGSTSGHTGDLGQPGRQPGLGHRLALPPPPALIPCRPPPVPRPARAGYTVTPPAASTTTRPVGMRVLVEAITVLSFGFWLFEPCLRSLGACPTSWLRNA